MAFSPIGEPCTKPLIRSSPLLLASSQVMNIPSNHICPPPPPPWVLFQAPSQEPQTLYGLMERGLKDCVLGEEKNSSGVHNLTNPREGRPSFERPGWRRDDFVCVCVHCTVFMGVSLCVW